MKKPTVIKRSTELNDLCDDIFNKLFAENKSHKFKPMMRKICTVFFDNDYLGVEEYANWGAALAVKAKKLKKPIYLVFGIRSNTYSFFIGHLSEIKSLLLKEREIVNIGANLKEVVKTINSLDAAILAYLALIPKPLKDLTALELLSKDTMLLGQCLLDIKGKYSKEVKKQANIYREWAIYKNAANSKRKNLNLYKINK